MKTMRSSREFVDMANRRVAEKMNIKEVTELKQEILEVVKFIDNERQLMDKIAMSSSKLADSLSCSSMSNLDAIKHRFKEVSILLDIQSIKRQSMKYNEELIRAYANSNHVVSNSTKRLNLRTKEHFKRAIPAKTTPKTVVFNDSRTSHWEGSDYKYSLILSLKKKLLLKLIFSAIECYRQMRVNARQAVFSADRLRTKKLLQLCFCSLRFEALTVRYIELNSIIKCDNLIRRKYIEPFFTEMYKKLYVAKQYARHVNRVADNYFKRKHLGHGLGALRRYNKYEKRLRALKVWSKTKSFISVQMKSFLAWIFVFVRKQAMRQSLQNRFGECGQLLSKQNSDKLSRSILVDIKRSISDPLGDADRRNPKSRSRVHLDLAEDRDAETITAQEFRDAVLDYSIASMRGMKHHIEKGRHYKPSNSSKTGSTGKKDKSLLVDTLYSEYFIRDFTHSLNNRRAENNTSGVSRMRSVAKSWSSEVQDSDCDSVMSADSLSPVDSSRIKTTKKTYRPHLRSFGDIDTSRGDTQTSLVVPLPSLIPSHLREHLVSAVALRKVISAAAVVPSTSNISRSFNSAAAGGGDAGSVGSGSVFSGSLMEDYRSAVNDEFSLLDHHSSCSDSPGGSAVNATSQSKAHYSSLINNSRSSFAAEQNRSTVMERALELSATLASPIQLKSPRVSAVEASQFNHSFCGAIQDGDSDFESNVLNHHYGISQMEVERRKAVFEEKMRNQFQLLKFNWIIKKLRFFVRKLHHMAKCSKGFTLVRQRHLRRTKDLAFSAWSSVYAKCRKGAQLCDQIYCVKLTRRMLRAWHECAVVRLRKCRQILSGRHRLTTLQQTLDVWSDFGKRVRTQRRAIESVNRVVMSQVWSTWTQLVRAKKRIFSLYRLVVLGRCRVRMNIWKEKFQRRRLLKRVFTVCETAWAYRSYYNSHHFYLLFNIFGAWRQYTKRSKRMLVDHQQNNKALYFRGISLLARFYFLWCDFVTQNRKTKRLMASRKNTQLRKTFAQWQAVLRARRHLLQDSSVYYHRSLCKRVFQHWKSAINYVTTEMPLEYKAGKLMRECFDAWRVLGRVVELQSRWVPLWEGRLLHRRFRNWHALCLRHDRCKQALPVLSDVYYRIKLRQCFLRWPGRLECLRARQMLTYIQRKGRTNRVRLVDVDQTVSETQVIKDRQLLDEERRKAEAVAKSFIQEKRLTLIQRAVRYRYIHGETDVEGIEYTNLLMSTVLKEWLAVVKSYRYYHALAVKVRYLQRRHIEKLCLRHWMQLTPATTHRSITWIHKRHKRLHDDYEFNKKDQSMRMQSYAAKMDEEYKEYLNNLKQVKMHSLLMGAV